MHDNTVLLLLCDIYGSCAVLLCTVLPRTKLTIVAGCAVLFQILQQPS